MTDPQSQRTRDLILRLLKAYNAADDSVFAAQVSDDLPWKAKVLDEIRSGRSGQVDTRDVVVDGERAAEYWVEYDMERDGRVIPEIWGVNIYRVQGDRVTEFSQIEEARG